MLDDDVIHRGAERITTPPSFASEACTLREHVDLVRHAVFANAAAAG